MRARFSIIGRVGKVYAGARGKYKYAYISVITSKLVDKKPQSVWHNNVVAKGGMVEHVVKNIKSGSVILVEGDISNFKNKAGAVITELIVTNFTNIVTSKSDIGAQIEPEGIAPEEAAYDEFENDIPY